MKRLIMLALGLGLTSTAGAQTTKACGYVGLRTTYKIERCLDTLQQKFRVADSLLKDRIQADRQIRLSIEDIYNKMPPNGRTVQEYVNSAVAAGLATIPPPSSGGGSAPSSNIFTGDVEIHGRLMVGNAIQRAKEAGLTSAYPVQILANGPATISGVSNLSGEQFQNPSPHYGYISFNDDGGILTVQNAGSVCRNGSCAYKDFIDPTREISTFGFDSRGTWVYDLREPGRVYGVGDRTQAVWLRPDYDRKKMLWAIPRAGYEWELLESTSATLLDRRIILDTRQ
ncbi:MAG: hypothetical protein H0U59_00740 [Gemmatimonadaceae bacterium]|nr:hypothetical protein [Gemmatimonadaceae bacterium]